MADALYRTRYFVLGCKDLTVVVVHKPLLGILGTCSLEAISNPRLRNLKEKTLRYQFKMMYIPGVKNKASDCMSRRPSGTRDPERPYQEDDITLTSANCATYLEQSPRSFMDMIRTSDETPTEIDRTLSEIASATLDTLCTITWDRVRLATNNNDTMLRLVEIIEDDIPESREDFPQALRECYLFRDDLYTVDGVVMYGGRVSIPLSLREECLIALHAAHSGCTSMLSRAECSIFWPGITPAIQRMRERCAPCNRTQPRAPPTPMTQPAYPFQCICADFFSYKGTNYLLVVDRYSNWPVVERASDGAEGLISCLRWVFATFGIADELSSDGGPEFTAAATRTFLTNWGVHHRLSSVAVPHSNSRAEVGVKTSKRMIMDNTYARGRLDTDKFQRAMLIYRNTPDHTTKLSRAQCVFGRPIKDLIPILPGRYQPHGTWRDTLDARETALRNRHMRSS